MLMLRRTVAWVLLVALSVAAAAQAGQTNLPYMSGTDPAGNQWVIYHQGWLQQQGNMPIYSQGARLTLNGAQVSHRGNVAQIDDETGEVVLDMQAGQFAISRRIKVDGDGGYVRYIDIIRNPTGQDLNANVQIQTNTNYGIQSSQIVRDPKEKGEQPIGWVAQTGANRAVVEVFAGQKSKLKPVVNAPQGNFVTAIYQVKVPRNDEVAIVHLHSTADNAAAGERWILDLKERQILDGIPRDLRKKIINFRLVSQAIGDYEILRGDVFDVIELRSGDQFRGNLKPQSYVLETFYGSVEVPVDRVIGMLNIGDIRPRQLLVTRDGEIFGGHLAEDAIPLELSTGQTIRVPLSQIARVGYRRQANEPEEWTFDRPVVLMQAGDRVGVQPPAEPIEVMTRYGRLELVPSAIAAISFLDEENRVHEVQLRDGSRFAGLVMADSFEMVLTGTGRQQAVRFPTASLKRFQVAPPRDEPDPNAATLMLSNGDLLVGKLTGELKLDTTFDTITLNGPEIRTISRGERQGMDVQISMWDQTTVSGQLQQDAIDLQLDSGLAVHVPVTLIQRYNQPIPQPSAAVADRIRALVAELNADDWKQRDRAEDQLTSMGVSVIGVLKELQPTQSPEARQRIDQILQRLEKELGQSRTAAPSNANAVEPALIEPQFMGNAVIRRNR